MDSPSRKCPYSFMGIIVSNILLQNWVGLVCWKFKPTVLVTLYHNHRSKFLYVDAYELYEDLFIVSGLEALFICVCYIM